MEIGPHIYFLHVNFQSKGNKFRDRNQLIDTEKMIESVENSESNGGAGVGLITRLFIAWYTKVISKVRACG